MYRGDALHQVSLRPRPPPFRSYPGWTLDHFQHSQCGRYTSCGRASVVPSLHLSKTGPCPHRLAQRYSQHAQCCTPVNDDGHHHHRLLCRRRHCQSIVILFLLPVFHACSFLFFSFILCLGSKGSDREILWAKKMGRYSTNKMP